MGKVLITDIQIRFADGDTLGHINNVSLQHYFDLGKMEFYTRAMNKTIEADSESLILASTHTDYYLQSHLYDTLFVETRVERIGNKSITFIQKLINAGTGAVNAECRTVAVAYDFVTGLTFPLKPEWIAILEEYLADPSEVN